MNIGVAIALIGAGTRPKRLPAKATLGVSMNNPFSPGGMVIHPPWSWLGLWVALVPMGRQYDRR